MATPDDRSEEVDREAPTDLSMAPPLDLTERIRDLAAPHEGERLHAEAIPPDTMLALRTHVLPREAWDAIVVAVAELPQLGDAVVLTPTHLYCRQHPYSLDFPLADLVTVEGVRDDGLWVEVRGQGKVAVPCAEHGAALATILEGLLF